MALSQNIDPYRMPRAGPRGINALRYIKSHPEWIVGVVVLLAALRPGRVGKWLGRSWVTWQMMYTLHGR